VVKVKCSGISIQLEMHVYVRGVWYGDCDTVFQELKDLGVCNVESMFSSPRKPEEWYSFVCGIIDDSSSSEVVKHYKGPGYIFTRPTQIYFRN